MLIAEKKRLAFCHLFPKLLPSSSVKVLSSLTMDVWCLAASASIVAVFMCIAIHTAREGIHEDAEARATLVLPRMHVKKGAWR